MDLSKYSLVSNEWIEKRIKELEKLIETTRNTTTKSKMQRLVYLGELKALEEIKEQLIPAN